MSRASTRQSAKASSRYTKYEPINTAKRTRTNIQSPLSPTYGTFQTIPSFEQESVHIDISQFQQNDMANTLKNMFMVIDKNTTFDRFFGLMDDKIDLINKFDLAAYHFNKDLIYPATLINILSRLNNLQIAKFDTKVDNPDLYATYGSQTTINYILTIIDTIGVKVLYLINHKGKEYLSPLNIRNTRDIIRKKLSNETSKLDSDAYIKKNNRDLRKKFNIESGINSKSIDASSYDVIMISEAFHLFIMNKNNIEIKLTNYDKKKDYKSSILANNVLSGRKEGHIISVNRCYNYTMVNTTWKPFYAYNVNTFTPGMKKFYHIHEVDKSFNEVDVPLIQEANLEYYYSQFIDKSNINLSLQNMHFFSSKLTKEWNGEGGNSPIAHSKIIPEISVCSDIYFPNNLHGFCWFSSIINSLFYADDISTLFLNKVIKNMHKTLDYIKHFYDIGYQSFDITNVAQLKEFTKHLIYLFTYIYCSFSILSKNQLHRIKNKSLWYDIYNKIISEYYSYIYVYIIVLSKTMKIDYTKL